VMARRDFCFRGHWRLIHLNSDVFFSAQGPVSRKVD
jgi:hypothetical protein